MFFFLFLLFFKPRKSKFVNIFLNGFIFVLFDDRHFISFFLNVFEWNDYVSTFADVK